ncbi:hypothetical protein OFN37_38735, partial [Escherichia coli]|nr:hypothetical protein [Escherichia coli]
MLLIIISAIAAFALAACTGNKVDESTSKNFISKAEEILQKGESDEEYQFRQNYAMKDSQNAAIYNAYKRANRTVS